MVCFNKLQYKWKPVGGEGVHAFYNYHFVSVESISGDYGSPAIPVSSAHESHRKKPPL